MKNNRRNQNVRFGPFYGRRITVSTERHTEMITGVLRAPLAKTPATKVRGCVSQVWIETKRSDDGDPILVFRGDSDAHIVRGLIAIVLAIFSGKSASQIVGTDETSIFERIRLSEHITPQRSNGLRSMVDRIKREASQALAA